MARIKAPVSRVAVKVDRAVCPQCEARRAARRLRRQRRRVRATEQRQPLRVVEGVRDSEEIRYLIGRVMVDRDQWSPLEAADFIAEALRLAGREDLAQLTEEGAEYLHDLF